MMMTVAPTLPNKPVLYLGYLVGLWMAYVLAFNQHIQGMWPRMIPRNVEIISHPKLASFLGTGP
jgi:hypothetical protein